MLNLLTVEMLDNLTEAIGYRDIALIELNTTIQNNQSLENIDKSYSKLVTMQKKFILANEVMVTYKMWCKEK